VVFIQPRSRACSAGDCLDRCGRAGLRLFSRFITPCRTGPKRLPRPSWLPEPEPYGAAEGFIGTVVASFVEVEATTTGPRSRATHAAHRRRHDFARIFSTGARRGFKGD